MISHYRLGSEVGSRFRLEVWHRREAALLGGGASSKSPTRKAAQFVLPIGEVVRTIPYQLALDESIAQRRHLLLGNGFSIAASEGFRYSSLFEVAFSKDDVRFREIFGRIGTTDFERVLSQLDTCSTVLACYPEAGATLAAVIEDRQQIARRLIDALAQIHPARSVDIAEPRFAASRAFLAETRRPNLPGLIFTTNYDLLLYWSTLRNGQALQTRDGFGPVAHELIWSENGDQSVFHLHGALHIFERPDGSLAKLRRQDEHPLIDQISGLIDQNLLPLFVTEGTSAQKVERIGSSPYLRDALSRFEAICGNEEDVLFVYGSALQDNHIVDLIPQGRISRVYVSAMDVEAHRPQMAALEAEWSERRQLAGLPGVEVALFPAMEAAPWGD